MTLSFQEIRQKALDGILLTRQEALAVLRLSDAELPDLLDTAYVLRKAHKGNTVGIHVLTNARSGVCDQDCVYCAQGRASSSPIERYSFADPKIFLDHARAGARLGIARHCIGLSGIRLDDALVDRLCRQVERLKEEMRTPVCCSLGFLRPGQARRLREAGVDRINHNLNTGRNFYPRICTSHSYDDRVRNIRMLQEAGFEICSGGIAGLGEDHGDLADMFLDLANLRPHSVPVNFFLPLAGTPLASRDVRGLTPEYCLKVLCLARLLLPGADLRCAAGREVYLKDAQPLLFRVADTVFASGYLTADGDSVERTIRQIQDAGFDYRLE
ncbi:MAG: biotin synthase BioB [Desulfovibrio sp.]|jgi:biotin synthase|nr:biotin synthase BioB [Desulfovibrio sp.]